MNTYEQERLANIAKNEALLKEIGLTGIKPPPKPKPATPAKRNTPRRNGGTPQEPVVRRTSSRLSGIPADSELAKRKSEEDDEAATAALLERERQKRARLEGPLNLTQMLQGDAGLVEAKKLLSDLSKTPIGSGGREVIEIKEESTAATDELQSIRRQFASLRLLSRWEPTQIKITPERIYSMEMHPGEKRLALAGDKAGYLGIWDVDGVKKSTIKREADEEDDDLEVDDPAIHLFKLHARSITAMAFDPVDASKLYTTSQDASIRCLDLATGVSDAIFASETDQAVTGLQLHPNGSQLYFSTVLGEVGIRDLRMATRTQSFHQLHERKIGALGMHPGNANLLVTSSLDRTMKVWDFRKLSNTATRITTSKKAPILLATHTASLSVSSAFFNAAGSIVATSYDNTLKVFHGVHGTTTATKNILEQDLVPDHSIHHNNTTGRWITVFKAAWQQKPADGIQKFVIGNMNRYMDVYNAQGQSLAQLHDEHITAIPAVVAMHPSQNWVVGGNASGRAYFFS